MILLAKQSYRWVPEKKRAELGSFKVVVGDSEQRFYAKCLSQQTNMQHTISKVIIKIINTSEHCYSMAKSRIQAIIFYYNLPLSSSSML